MRPNKISSDVSVLDENLRKAVGSGDAYDIKCALSALHNAGYLEILKAVEGRVEKIEKMGLVSSGEVIDRVMTRGYEQLVSIATEMAEPGKLKQAHHFLKGDISGIEFLLRLAGFATRGVIGDLLRTAKNRQRLAKEARQIESPAVLPGRDARRFSMPEAEDVIDTSQRILALNAALAHLEPKERLAVALMYDILEVHSVTNQKAMPEKRAAILYDLARSFGYPQADSELLRYRFLELVAARGMFGETDSRTLPRLRQKDVGVLLGNDEPETSRMLADARAKMRVQLKAIDGFAA